MPGKPKKQKKSSSSKAKKTAVKKSGKNVVKVKSAKEKKHVKKHLAKVKITAKTTVKKKGKETGKELTGTIIIDELLAKNSTNDPQFQRLDREAKELFHIHRKWSVYNWVKKYSPVLIPLLVGLMTYAYLTLFVFYPNIIAMGIT